MTKPWIPRAAVAAICACLAAAALPTVLLLILSYGSSAAAPSSLLSITPVIVTIPASHRSAVISLSNPNDHPVNVQISPFAWTQDADGNDALSPTRDLIVYPLIFTMRPHGERTVRLGTLEAPLSEKTYRLLIQTLPSLQDGDALNTAGIRLLTKASVPVFLEPKKPAAPQVEVALDVHGGQLRLRVTNNGTVHVPPQEIDIRGFASGDAAPILTGAARGWYLLPRISRTHDIPLPSDKCSSLARIDVALRYGTHTTTQQISLPEHACTGS